MDKDRRDYLINLFESRKKQRGRFTYLFEEYRSLIESMYQKGDTIFTIGDAIEKGMDYSFAKTKYNVRDSFYRALQIFIRKKKEPHRIKSIPHRNFQNIENSMESSPTLKKDRSNLTGITKQQKPFQDHEPS